MPSAEEAVFEVQVYFQLLAEDNEKAGGSGFQKSYPRIQTVVGSYRQTTKA